MEHGRSGTRRIEIGLYRGGGKEEEEEEEEAKGNLRYWVKGTKFSEKPGASVFIVGRT